MITDGLPDALSSFSDLSAEDLQASVLERLAWRRRHGRKHCGSCSRDLPVAAFGKDSSRADALDVRCRECRKARRST